jgi:drug/metabolite transporter (DMT)-like permease
VPPRNPIGRAYIACMAVCVLWGTTYLGIRIALETVPPARVGGLRFTAAGILLVTVLAGRGDALIRPAQWGGLALTGILTARVAGCLVRGRC